MFSGFTLNADDSSQRIYFNMVQFGICLRSRSYDIFIVYNITLLYVVKRPIFKIGCFTSQLLVS